ncbi:glycosyltransferase family 4 protein [Fictibacillus nanhaiensis]|uniref:glycosyltransferase n=1 Tax=Fictibacillus nanhaiensis TaxID=742169 RepID=UPI001C969B38|nr:glycosyltransferase [Fictibacillus nanhaiensis]MBY6035951.1 glycosyltransferase family 4 protein [Fictibacillus nanhaiensis]
MADSTLKIVFFTPYYHQNRGNSTTARRIHHGLSERDVSISVFAYEEEPLTQKIYEDMENADVLHILHFARFAKWSEKHKVHIQKPYIITSGGTDINHSLEENKERYASLLNQAKAITVFTDDAKDFLVQKHGFKDDFIHVIPQSVYFPESISSEKLSLPTGYPKLLLPAGLRPVKDVLYALPPIEKLINDYPDTVFLILGANLDEKVHEQLKLAQKKYDWLEYSPEIDLSNMKHVYQWADIVLNTSLSEGQPTSLLEAMSEHTPVVARFISGNKSIVRHEWNGMLFQTEDELYVSLKQLVSDKAFYHTISQNGYQNVKEHHMIEKEIRKYIKLYEQKKERKK